MTITDARMARSAMAHTAAALTLDVNDFGFGRKGAFLPDHGWSAGEYPSGTTKVVSNVHWDSWTMMRNQPDFSDRLAYNMDTLGVTADQFYEAFDLMGNAAFILGANLAVSDENAALLARFLADTAATKDLRYAYYLVSFTLHAELPEIVAFAKKLGYHAFFTYAGRGLSFEQIRDIEENDIDASLVESLIAGIF